MPPIPSFVLENPMLFFVVPILIIFGVWFGYLLRKDRFPYFATEYITTLGEKPFFDLLVKLFEDSKFMVCPKVRLADIINCDEKDWHKGYGPMISAKHIDFVLVYKNTAKIALCIELDDRSHENNDRKKRDRFVNGALEAAGVPLLRIKHAQSYDKNKISKVVHARIYSNKK